MSVYILNPSGYLLNCSFPKQNNFPVICGSSGNFLLNFFLISVFHVLESQSLQFFSMFYKAGYQNFLENGYLENIQLYYISWLVLVYNSVCVCIYAHIMDL